MQIENPQDRKKSKDNDGNGVSDYPSIIEQMAGMEIGSSKDDEKKKNKTTTTKFISFVSIPHDDSKPMKTLQLPLGEEEQRGGDAIPEYVRSYFADSKSIDVGLLKDQATKHFAGGQLEQLAKTNLSASTMTSVAAQGQVETFVLVHPADTNRYQGVYILN